MIAQPVQRLSVDFDYISLHYHSQTEHPLPEMGTGGFLSGYKAYWGVQLNIEVNNYRSFIL